MHFRAITRIVGLLVIIFSFTMVIPGIVALIYRDGAGRAFSQTFVTALLIGLFLWLPTRNSRHELKAKEVLGHYLLSFQRDQTFPLLMLFLNHFRG